MARHHAWLRSARSRSSPPAPRGGAALSRDGRSGALRSIKPSGSGALQFATQLRTICRVTPRDPRGFAARRTAIDRGKRQKTAGARRILGPTATACSTDASRSGRIARGMATSTVRAPKDQINAASGSPCEPRFKGVGVTHRCTAASSVRSSHQTQSVRGHLWRRFDTP